MQKVLMVFTLLVAANIASTGSAPKTLAENKNIVTAHRGSSAAAPENTLSSIRKAIRDGAGYAEIDVQETADGVVILMHDNTARRTAGIDKPVWEIDSGELRKASAGAWFGKQFEDDRVPTLDEAIQTSKGRIRLNIELKNNGHQKQLAEKTVALLQKHKFENHCTITSFDPELLRKVKKLRPGIKTGRIIGEKSDVTERLYASNDYEVISAAYPLIDEQFMRDAREHHKEVYAWTVNEKKSMQRMVSLGVDSVITNEPERLVRLLKTIPKER